MGRGCARHEADLWLLEGPGNAGQSYPLRGPWECPELQQTWTRGDGFSAGRQGYEIHGGGPAALTPSNGPLSPRQKGQGGGLTFL